MDILTYIENKKNYYESMENEYRLLYKKNQNMIKELISRVEMLKNEEKEDFQSRFVPGRKEHLVELEIKELEIRIAALEKENKDYQEHIAEFVEELRILNDLVAVEKDPASQKIQLLKKIQFCCNIAEQDPHRCKLELEALLRTFRV